MAKGETGHVVPLWDPNPPLLPEVVVTVRFAADSIPLECGNHPSLLSLWQDEKDEGKGFEVNSGIEKRRREKKVTMRHVAIIRHGKFTLY